MNFTFPGVVSSFGENPYPVLEISQSALRHNLSLVKKITGPAVKILVPVKANAYGCGLAEIIHFLQKEGPEYVGVANLFEGQLVRQYGWPGKILNLGGFFPHMSNFFTDFGITPSVTDLWQVEVLDEAARKKNLVMEIHIKVDLGMGRIGILPGEIDSLLGRLKEARHLKVRGIFTHFPSSDLAQAASNANITARFREVSAMMIEELALARRDVILHAANSYAVMLNPDSHFDMVRPGLSFYGYFSNMADKETLFPEFPFQPALELTARPVSVRTLAPGMTVSYGESFCVGQEPLEVGVIPIGYADGIPRSLSNKISFQGHPLLGRVTMDQIVVGGLTRLADTINLLGDASPPLEVWADLSNTITYEIMVNLGERIQRKLL